MTLGSRSLAILGGTGFFGKSFLDSFRRGLLAPWGIDRVIAIARQPEVLRAEHPELVGPGVELLALDVETTDALPRVDYLVHAANSTDARRYASDPLAERAAIVAAADNFVRCVVTNGGTTRIVYTSSGAVYGQQSTGIDRIDEDATLADPETMVAYKRDYAEAKRLAETVVAGLGHTHGMRVSVARCFAFVGFYLPRDQHFAIGNFLADGLARRPVTVNARYPVIRSYMHADDLVRWLMTIADHATSACPIYNVGSEEGVDVTDLARRVATRFDVGVHVPQQAVSPVDRYVPSTARAAEELGLSLDFDLDRALDDMVERLDRDPLVRVADSATPQPE